jgi:hypothetical protein
MKKITLLVALFCLTFSALAQFPQTLPIDHTVFFRIAAMGTDPTLEKATYATTSDAILANQWNRSGKTTNGEGGGASPTVETNALGYSNYIDNQMGKTINLTPTAATTIRSTPYSLTAANEYTAATFYAGMLVKFTTVTGSGVDFFAFDSNYTGNAQRGRIFIKASANTGFYNMGIGFSGSGDVGTSWSTDLAIGSTYLVVASISVAATGTETIKLYINPTLGSVEGDNTPVNSGTYTAALFKIRALTIRQRPEFAGMVAGLRFSNSWADIVKGGGISTSVENPGISNFANVSNKSIQLQELGNVDIYNMQGAKLISATNTRTIDTNLNKGVYLLRFTNITGKVKIQKIIIQ